MGSDDVAAIRTGAEDGAGDPICDVPYASKHERGAGNGAGEPTSRSSFDLPSLELWSARLRRSIRCRRTLTIQFPVQRAETTHRAREVESRVS